MTNETRDGSLLKLIPSYPHPLIENVLKSIRRANQGPPKKIMILGAGAAGLVAAYELGKLGHDVTVFEARERIGGRIHTQRFSDGSYNEIGAMRIAASHDYVHHYINEVGLKENVIPFTNSIPENFLDIRGKVCRLSQGRTEIYPLFETSDYQRDTPDQYPGGAIFGWVTGNTIDTLTAAERKSLFEGRLDTDYLLYLANTSLGEYFDTRVSADVKEMIGSFTSLSVWWDKAVTMFIRDNIVGTGDGLTGLRGGMDQLTVRLAEEVEQKARIKLNTEVTGITLRSENCIELRYLDENGQSHTDQFDNVLCTIPFAVMRRMELDGLSIPKMRAIRDMAYASATKVLLHCRERFWQSKYGIYAGGSISDHIQRQTFYPMDHAEFASLEQASRYHGVYSSTPHTGVTKSKDADDREPGVLIGAYAWGRDSRRLGALDESERAEIVMNNIERFHPEIREYVTDSASIDWEQEKFSAGAFSFLRPGQLHSLFPDAIKPEGRLFFAGEHCSTDQAWIQGAMISSLQAVLDIVGTGE